MLDRRLSVKKGLARYRQQRICIFWNQIRAYEVWYTRNRDRHRSIPKMARGVGQLVLALPFPLLHSTPFLDVFTQLHLFYTVLPYCPSLDQLDGCYESIYVSASRNITYRRTAFFELYSAEGRFDPERVPSQLALIVSLSPSFQSDFFQSSMTSRVLPSCVRLQS